MIGRILGNRYKVLEKIGIGGMAIVYKAEDTLLKRLVAIKVLKDQYVEDEDFLKKFAMEAQSAASLSHPNIVSIYDVGSEKVNQKNVNYIVMEYVKGKTLKELILEKGFIPSDQLANFAEQIASALDCAHKNNIIHRDIKPQNILIDTNGSVKVTDFGIARISTSATITYTSSVLGTVHYISPEQAKGKFIDEKSDIYSLGVVMYEMATGKVPFDAANAVGIALKHIQDPLISPKELNDQIPDGINSIIIKALEKNPANRFQTAKELCEVLRNYKKLDETVTISDTNLDQTSKIERPVNQKNNLNKPREETKEAVYTMARDEEQAETKPVKKKGGFFQNTVVPILLAILIFSGAVYAYNYWNDLQIKNQVVVPAIIGLKKDEAIKAIENMGLVAKVTEEKNDSAVGSGNVISQRPSANTKAKKGDTVELTISLGQKMVRVPNLTGKSIEDVENILKRDNLVQGIVTREYSDTYEEGIVMSQDPMDGTEVAEGTKINITVSSGEEVEQVSMPNLIGMTEDDAFKTLDNFDLKLGTVERVYNSVYEIGVVIGQSYPEGTKLNIKTTVNLSISKGPDPAGTTGTNYKFDLQRPGGDGTFNIKIVNKSTTEIVYQGDYSRTGDPISLSINASAGSQFIVYYDGIEQPSTVTTN